MSQAHDTSDRPDTRTRILVEAERLFRHYGYAKTTVADIARELGMSPANVYRFFPSKSAIVEAMAEAILTAHLANLRIIAVEPLPARDRIKRILLASHEHARDTLACDPKAHEVVKVAIDEQWHVVLDYIHGFTALLAGLVEDGVASGEFPPQNAKLSGRCVGQSFVSWDHPYLIATCGSDPEAASPSDLADFILDAVCGRRPLARA